jgi:hypothetical protein
MTVRAERLATFGILYAQLSDRVRFAPIATNRNIRVKCNI